MEDEQIIPKIFQQMKKQNWSSVKSLILSDTCYTHDYNAKDGENKNIITYLIENNQLDIIKLLFEKQNIYIDFLDGNGKSILFNIIKNKQTDALKLILEYNKKSIGKSVLNVIDTDGNTPIFYAIDENIYIDEIMKHPFNVFIRNKAGNTVLHHSILKTDDINHIAKLNFSNINVTNSSGETPLHVAIKYKRYETIKYLLKHKNINVNAIEYKYEFSILHYITIIFDETVFELFGGLAEMNVNLQDRYGKTPYFYFISGLAENKFTKPVTKFNERILQKFNYNLFDINGDIPLNFALKTTGIPDSIIENLITFSNLNIQNFIGESGLYIMVKNGMWKRHKQLLEIKKLDIFIVAKRLKPMMGFIEKTEVAEFIRLVATSYINQLTKNKKSWNAYWDKKCANIKSMKLSVFDKLMLDELNIKRGNNGREICLSVFESAIKRGCSSFPIPSIEQSIKITISEYPNTMSDANNYIGSTLEILCGELYLLTKHDEVFADLMRNGTNFVKCAKNGKSCELFGFAVTWKNDKLFDFVLPSSSNKRFFIAPLQIDVTVSGVSFHHLNYIIFDIVEQEVERFEPHGSDPPFGFDYGYELLDAVLQKKCVGFKYFSPSMFLPKIGFQVREMNEEGIIPLQDPDGFCSLWCVWWCEMRLTYSTVGRVELVKMLFKELVSKGISLKKMIRNYSYFITSVRDVILEKVGITAVEWNNNDMEDGDVKRLNEVLNEVIVDRK